MKRTHRRKFLKAVAGASAFSTAVDAASAHDMGSSKSSSTSEHDHTDASIHGKTSDVELLDYHSLGQRGPSSTNSADSPHYGGISEMRVVGDYAYVCFFSSKDPTNNRGIGVTISRRSTPPTIPATFGTPRWTSSRSSAMTMTPRQ
ncbi:hypothetical protein [Haladaptatus pallidirubidus]|uniref:hypothetical protein n=1 Tax=Haladaptatus pallidirubidus TaxID=1008152 RepID=UPI001D1224A6|nr:hypothetical protein [Haladaptatus pallidirubidus]